MMTIELNVGGMTCEGCERSISNALSRIDGVLVVTADHRTGRVTVDAERAVPADELQAAVEDAGYVFVPPGAHQLPTT